MDSHTVLVSGHFPWAWAILWALRAFMCAGASLVKLMTDYGAKDGVELILDSKGQAKPVEG